MKPLPPPWPLKARLAVIFLACLWALAMITGHIGTIQYAFDRSLPHRWWMVRYGVPSAPAWGAHYVIGGLPENAVIPVHRRIIKRLVAMPGDRIEVHTQQVAINGRVWGPVDPSVPNLNPSIRILQPDEYFVLGTSERSFDSRYFGPVRRSQLLASAHPLD